MCNILSRHKGELLTKVNEGIYFYIIPYTRDLTAMR